MRAECVIATTQSAGLTWPHDWWWYIYSLSPAIDRFRWGWLRAGTAEVYPFVPERAQAASLGSLPLFIAVDVSRSQTCADLITAVLNVLKVAAPAPGEYVLYELTEYGLSKCAPFQCPGALLVAGDRIKLHRSRCQFVLRHLNSAELKVTMLPPNLQSLVTRNAVSFEALRRKTKPLRSR